jgi:hypothetical protein
LRRAFAFVEAREVEAEPMDASIAAMAGKESTVALRAGGRGVQEVQSIISRPERPGDPREPGSKRFDWRRSVAFLYNASDVDKYLCTALYNCVRIEACRGPSW